MIRTVGLALALALVFAPIAACKKKDSSPGPMAPLPDDNAGSGSGSAQPADPTPPASDLSDADFEKLMQETMAFFTTLGNAMEAAGTNCPEMAASIRTTSSEHGDFLARVKKLDRDPSVGDRGEAWMQAHADTVKPVFAKIGEGMETCGENEDVRKAFDELGTL